MIVTSPADPTGALVPRRALRDLRARLPEHVLLIVDEALGEFAPDGEDAAGLVADVPGLVVLRSFSKAHAMAGLRAGAALGPAELVARLAPSGGVSAPAQAAATLGAVARRPRAGAAAPGRGARGARAARRGAGGLAGRGGAGRAAVRVALLRRRGRARAGGTARRRAGLRRARPALGRRAPRPRRAPRAGRDRPPRRRAALLTQTDAPLAPLCDVKGATTPLRPSA